MENLTVKHTLFGKGTVVSQDEKHVSVAFEKVGEKTFVYPDAFSKFLSFEDASRQSEILAVIEAKKIADSAAADALREERMAKFEEEKKRAAEAEKQAKKRTRSTAKSKKA